MMDTVQFQKLFKAAIRAETVNLNRLTSASTELHVVWKIPPVATLSDVSLTQWMKTVLLPLGELLDWNQQPQIDLLTKQIAEKDKELKEVWEEYSQYKRLVQEARR